MFLLFVIQIFSVHSTDGANGCCGGLENHVYAEHTGYVLEEDYPYVSGEKSSPCKPFNCSLSGKPIAVTIEGHDFLPRYNTTELKKLVWMYGPVSGGLVTNQLFGGYKSGILDCTDQKLNGGHAVVVVGFGDGYFILRNSWGPDWGMDGDFYLSDKDFNSSCHLLLGTIDVSSLITTRVFVNPIPCHRA